MEETEKKVCPFCNKPLTIYNHSLVCLSCGRTYEEDIDFEYYEDLPVQEKKEEARLYFTSRPIEYFSISNYMSYREKRAYNILSKFDTLLRNVIEPEIIKLGKEILNKYIQHTNVKSSLDESYIIASIYIAYRLKKKYTPLSVILYSIYDGTKVGKNFMKLVFACARKIQQKLKINLPPPNPEECIHKVLHMLEAPYHVVKMFNILWEQNKQEHKIKLKSIGGIIFASYLAIYGKKWDKKEQILEKLSRIFFTTPTHIRDVAYRTLKSYYQKIEKNREMSFLFL